MQIAAQFSNGYWQPAQPFPDTFFEIVASPAGYTVVTPNDIVSANPPTSPGGWITQVFSGSRTVADSYFGLHHHLFPEGGRPTAIAQCMRGHDIGSGTNQKRGRWQRVNTARGVYDWERLDQWVNTAASLGYELMFTLSPCPEWASARPSEAGAYGLGSASEPASLSDWTAWCTAVATRYSSVIKYWEVWNEVNLPSFYSGTKAILSQLTRLAKDSIKAVDATAKIIAPNVVSLQTGDGAAYWSAMMDASDGAGGAMKDHIDIVGVHLYPNNAAGVSSMAAMVTAIQAAMSAKGLGALPLWNTEYGVLQPLFYSQNREVAKVQLQRMLVVPAAMGVARSFWYGLNVGDAALKAPDGSGYTFDVQDHWNEVRRILRSGPITVCNVCKDGSVGAIINGQGYIF